MTDWREALIRSWVPERWLMVAGHRIALSPGGGRRLNSALCKGDEGSEVLAALAAAMRDEGLTPTFQVAPGSEADDALAAKGFRAEAETWAWSMDAPAPQPHTPHLELYHLDAPLAWMESLWQAEGVDAPRIAAMRRAEGAQFLMARRGAQIAGVAFMGASAAGAMLHALAVPPAHRRRGVAGALMACASRIAAEADHTRLLWLAEASNLAANSLYQGLGARCCLAYHYRVAP